MTPGAGVAAGDDTTVPPSLSVYYAYNAADSDHADGFRPPRTTEGLVHLYCPHARRIEGVQLLGKHAVGCWKETDDRIDVSVDALYDLDRPAGWPDAPHATLRVELVTTRAHFAADWPVGRLCPTDDVP